MKSTNMLGNNPFRPRWSKVLADLWDNKTRTILVVSSIAVGVFAIGAIATSYSILSEDLDKSYAAVNPANIEINTSSFDDDFLRSIMEIPGVKQAEGRHSLVVTVMQEGQPWQGLELTAIDDFQGSQINLRDPKEALSIPGKKEIVLGFEPMRDSGFRVGDVLPVRLPDGTLRPVQVVGSVQDQTAIGDFSAPNRGYIQSDSLVWLGQGQDYNRLLATVSRVVAMRLSRAWQLPSKTKIERAGVRCTAPRSEIARTPLR
jgi:putative ABC transport system permease protein